MVTGRRGRPDMDQAGATDLEARQVEHPLHPLTTQEAVGYNMNRVRFKAQDPGLRTRGINLAVPVLRCATDRLCTLHRESVPHGEVGMLRWKS